MVNVIITASKQRRGHRINVGSGSKHRWLLDVWATFVKTTLMRRWYHVVDIVTFFRPKYNVENHVAYPLGSLHGEKRKLKFSYWEGLLKQSIIVFYSPFLSCDIFFKSNTLSGAILDIYRYAKISKKRHRRGHAIFLLHITIVQKSKLF